MLAPAEHAVEHSTELALAVYAIAAAAVGLTFAVVLYIQSPELVTRLRSTFAGLYRLLKDKYFVDEIYDALIVRPLVRALGQGALPRGRRRAIDGWA